MQKKLILSIDFDGVIHSYISGWQGEDKVKDEPVPGAIRWLANLIDSKMFEICIFSSRSKYETGREAMKDWLRGAFIEEGLADTYVNVIQFPSSKPPAYLTLDDRAITFKGEFPTIRDIRAFEPWYSTQKKEK